MLPAKQLASHEQSGASAPDGFPVHWRRSERDRDLGGAQSPWMDRMCGVGNGGVHYGLVSRVKPCSRATFSRTSSLRFLATGGGGREEKETDSGWVCCLQHANAARKSFAACLAPLIVVDSSESSAAGSPDAPGLLGEDGSKARSYTPVSSGMASARSGEDG